MTSPSSAPTRRRAPTCLYEVKCKSALCKKYSAGKGSAALGGQPKSMGHKIGFGNTEEEEASAHPRL